MDYSSWIIAISTFFMFVATAVIAVNTRITYKSMQKNERERSDLYNAMVVSNIMCSAPKNIKFEYKEMTEILKNSTKGKLIFSLTKTKRLTENINIGQKGGFYGSFSPRKSKEFTEIVDKFDDNNNSATPIKKDSNEFV